MARGIKRRRLCTCVLPVVLAMTALAAAQQAANEPEANPARPTVATPAALTPTGYLQFETGTLTARHSPEFGARTGVNEVMKLAVSDSVELLLSAEPLVHYSVAGAAANSTSDVFIGVQTVLHHGSGAKPTLAASYLRQVFDGGIPDVDFGSPRNSLLLLASADLRGFHYDANAMFNEVRQERVSRLQVGQTLSVSHKLSSRFTVAGELWHFTQPFLKAHAVGNLWALSYSARKNLVLDAGFDRGITSTSTRWEVFAGFTYLLPRRLW